MSDDVPEIQLALDPRLFECDAILAAAYTLADRAAIVLGSDSRGDFLVTISPHISPDGDHPSDLEREFRQAVVDHQIRIRLEKRFGHLRDTIVEHAFSRAAGGP